MFDLIQGPSGFTQKTALKIINEMYWFHIANGGIGLLRAGTMIRLTDKSHGDFYYYPSHFPPWDASQDNIHV